MIVAPARAGAASARFPRRRPTGAVATVPPLPARLQLSRSVFVALAVLSMGIVVQLVIVSPLQQRSAQQRAFDRLRSDLAAGIAPLAGVDIDTNGTPVAYLEIPKIGVRQVVVEGTDAGSLLVGPGHRRDTPLPGQGGTSVVMGRRGAYGGPFSRVAGLRRGDVVHVTTGQGSFDFRVVGVRRAGDPAPPPVRAGGGRIVLATADGRAFLPSGLLLVDADLVVPAVPAGARRVSADTLPENEKMLAVDTSALWRLVLWLQVLLAVVVGAVFAWHRWPRVKAWAVLLPPLLFTGLMTAGEAARLLPNLL